MTTSQIHDQSYELYTWQDFGSQIFTLSKRIIESGESFDRIIALARGGIAISRPLRDLCGIKEMGSVQIEFYTGIATTGKTPIVTQSLPISIRDERVLIVDDVADSGETLILATNYIRHHGAQDIKTATLVTKSWTKFKPDFFSHQSDAWIIFPWEIRETITLLSAIWKEKGDSDTLITKQLETVGFKKEEIDLFCY